MCVSEFRTKLGTLKGYSEFTVDISLAVRMMS